MQEDFLHYIWRFQHFNREQLQTSDGARVQVLKTGFWNKNAGPDFLEAKVLLNDIEWNGHVEIHLKSSDWESHQHQTDQAYNNVILHVVWKDDRPILRKDGTTIPTLELKNRVDLEQTGRYKQLVLAETKIPCQPFWPEVSDLTKSSMLERALVERLQQKSEGIKEVYRKLNGDWEAATYHLLVSNFGFKVNKAAFDALAYALPYQLVKKYRHNSTQLNALLFGAAGFLEQVYPDNEYQLTLQKEWQFLSHKHKNQLGAQLHQSQWRFLRLRPANFPTIRIAQLAQLLHQQTHLFDWLKADFSMKQLMKDITVVPDDYWRNHYTFEKESDEKRKKLGKSSANILLINTVPVLLALYAKQTDQPTYMEKALDALQLLSAEHNSITRVFAELGSKNRSAFDSQSYIALYNTYCQKKRCANCSVGISILKT